jgi:hypothetical protein
MAIDTVQIFNRFFKPILQILRKKKDAGEQLEPADDNMLKALTKTYEKTDKKTGIVSRVTEEIKFDSIETVTVHQTVFERLLDTGTVCITGRGGIIINLSNLDDPLTVKKEIDKIYLK